MRLTELLNKEMAHPSKCRRSIFSIDQPDQLCVVPSLNSPYGTDHTLTIPFLADSIIEITEWLGEHALDWRETIPPDCITTASETPTWARDLAGHFKSVEGHAIKALNRAHYQISNELYEGFVIESDCGLICIGRCTQAPNTTTEKPPNKSVE